MISVSDENDFSSEGILNVLTDEPFDAQWLDLHIDQKSAVCLHQCRGQGKYGFGMSQLYHPCGDAVDQTGDSDTQTHKEAMEKWNVFMKQSEKLPPKSSIFLISVLLLQYSLDICFYLIFACTVSESSRFMGRGVTDPDAVQLVPGRLIFIDPFP